MKKKIAILLFGHLRSYDQTHASLNSRIESLKENYDCDIFIHTWSEKDPTTPTWHKDTPLESKQISEKDITSTYNPKSFLIETQKIKNPHEKKFNQCVEGLIYSTYSRHRVNNLKTQHEQSSGSKYDLVIMTRPDVWFFSDFFLDEIEDTEPLWLCRTFSKPNAVDILCFSSSQNIDLLSNYYHHYKDFINSEISRNFERNEDIFYNYLENLKIPLKTSTYTMPRDWRIHRSTWPNEHHKIGNAKWDRDEAIKRINTDDRHAYFRRND